MLLNRTFASLVLATCVSASQSSVVGNDATPTPRMTRGQQPDLQIGKTLGSYLGDDVYTSSGAGQQIGIKVSRRGKGKYYFAVQSDIMPGADPILEEKASIIADSPYTLVASGKRKKLQPTYYALAPVRTNITAQMIAGTYQTISLLEGASTSFETRIKAKGKAKRRKVRAAFYVRSDDEMSGLDIKDTAIIITKKNR